MATPAFRKYAAAAERIERLLSSTERKNRTSLAMRPLHRMWRRTIDQIELARVGLPVRRLPASMDGLVACQISDFHVDRDEDVTRLERAVDLINRQEPDLVFLTGDYFSGSQTMRRFVEPFGRILRDLRPRLAALAIAGNHDHWAGIELIAQALSGAGIELLSNASRRFAVRGERLQIVGIDDLWTRRAEPSRAFSSVEPGDCTIVLAHNPDTAPHIVEYKPGVMLSGHTHGGVVRIPLYGTPLKSILRIGKQYYSGLNRYGDFYIYTNRGLGTFWVRVRMNCRPEVSRFSLVPLRPGDNRRITRKRRTGTRR